MTYSEQATAATEELDGELDEFLGALTALGGSAGNVRLREVLEWDDAAYRLAFLEHDRYPMAWEQLLGSLEGFGLISSEDRRHRNALG